MPIVYRYDVAAAIADKILCGFSLKFVGVTLASTERMEYDDIEKYLREHPTDWNLQRFENLPYAMKKAYLKRKMLLQDSTAKIQAAAALIMQHPGEKIIIFSEFTRTADAIEGMVRPMRPCFKYHSNIPAALRALSLKAFRDGIDGVLLTARALDEGLDVPNASVAVIVAGSKTARQAIQRLGRILRQQAGKHAIIYLLYCKDTVEYFEMERKENILGDAAKSVEWR